MLALLPDLVFIHDLQQSRHIYCSARLETVLGLSTEQFLNSGFGGDPELFHSDDRELLHEWSARLKKLKDHEITQVEYRMRHADGRWRRLRVKAAPAFRDQQGILRLLSCSATDITEQTQAGPMLTQHDEILRLILNSMTEGVIVCDQHGKTLMVNRSAERMLKLDEPLTRLSQIRRAQAAETRKGESFRLWHQHPLVRALKGETLSDQELALYDRRRDLAVTLSHSAAPLTDGEGKIIGAVDVFRDVTESHRALQELQRAEEHFRLLVEGTTDYAIFMLDGSGHIVSWNPGAERILGYRKAEIVGSHVSVFFTPEDQEKGEPQRLLRQAALDGRSEEDSWRVRKDGQRFWCTGAMGALHDSAGRVQGFVEIMHEALINADRDTTRVAVLLLDLDRFKSINDHLGHPAGDELLRLVAQRLLRCVRETDTVARLGGDEFVVILTRLKSLSAAELIAENIVRELGHNYEIEHQLIKSGASVGIAMYPQDGQDTGELLQKADLAMYRAKASGRNRFRVFAPSMLTEVQLRQTQEDLLRQSVEQGDFELVYQPQIDLQTLAFVAVEALLRCRNHGLMTLSAKALIALAEEIGVINDLGSWVMRAACIQMGRWRAAGLPEFRIAVNVSAAQLLDPLFPGMMRSALQDAALPPRLLEIEVNESALVLVREGQSMVLDHLKSIGVSISIDDFGTGISTLSFLKDFPVDVLKLDPALIRNLPRDREDAAIVSAIVKLAKDLNIKVVAEGVETVEQLGFLRGTTCPRVQGYLFSEPVRPEKLEQLLQSRQQQGQVFH
jgi:diguanylate cyclase (GGDEF)-like protein/PAS domain S-box-containing protein